MWRNCRWFSNITLHTEHLLTSLKPLASKDLLKEKLKWISIFISFYFYFKIILLSGQLFVLNILNGTESMQMGAGDSSVIRTEENRSVQEACWSLRLMRAKEKNNPNKLEEKPLKPEKMPKISGHRRCLCLQYIFLLQWILIKII